MRRMFSITALLLAIAVSVQAVTIGGGTILGTWNKGGEKSFAFAPKATVVLATPVPNVRWISSVLALYSDPSASGDIETIAITEGVEWWKQVGSLRFQAQFEIGPMYEVDVTGDSTITIDGGTYVVTTNPGNATRFLALSSLSLTVHKFLTVGLTAGYVPYNNSHDAMIYGLTVGLNKPLF